MKKSVIKLFVAGAWAVAILIALSILPLQAASLNLGQGEGSPGWKASIPLNLTGGSDVVAASADITYDPSVLKNPVAQAGESARSAGKEVHTSIPRQGVLRVSVLGMNLGELPDGVIATITFDVDLKAPLGKQTRLGISPSASDKRGNPVAVKGKNGFVAIK